MRETINKSKIDEILEIQRLNTQMGKIQQDLKKLEINREKD